MMDDDGTECPTEAKRRNQPLLRPEVRERAARDAMTTLRTEIDALKSYQEKRVPFDHQLYCRFQNMDNVMGILEASIAWEQSPEKPRNHCCECQRKLQYEEPAMLNKANQEVSCLSCHLRIEGQFTDAQSRQLSILRKENRVIIRSGTHEAPNEQRDTEHQELISTSVSDVPTLGPGLR